MKAEKSNSRGFTLIELLVVIAIIGLLSTLAIVALGTARLKSRDARRVADLKQIQTALELYASDNSGTYPSTSSIALGDSTHACLNNSGFQPTGCTGTVYIANIPKDPGGGFYQYSGGGNDFAVQGYLEGTVNNLSKAIAVTPNQGADNYNFTYGLAGWWKFDEGVGSTAKDASGNGNDGVLSGGATWTTGKMGSAIQFDGSTGNVARNNPLFSFPMGNSARTMTVWIRRAADAAQNMYGIAEYGVASSDNQRYGILMFSNNGAYSPAYNLIVDDSYSTTPWFDVNYILNDTTNWHQLVAVADGNNGVFFYIDGNLVKSGTHVWNTVAANSQFVVGKTLYNSSNFPGIIDDVRVYNRPLSAAEVQAMYNSQK